MKKCGLLGKVKGKGKKEKVIRGKGQRKKAKVIGDFTDKMKDWEKVWP